MPRELCFVLMPFGRKQDAAGRWLEFDAIYSDLIAPGVERADLEPLRADQEEVGGIIHKPMFERLVLCRYAVADLTAANANVFYELGVRHGVRPYSTVLLFGEGGRLPFDVQDLRCIPYGIGLDGRASKPGRDSERLAAALAAARSANEDSPVFQLVEGLAAQPIDHAKTDVFRERVKYSTSMKDRLARARAAKGTDAPAALGALERELGRVEDAEAGVVVDLFLSYRAVKAWDQMVRLSDLMSPPLRDTVMVQEQLALALNRLGEGDRAERVLIDLIERRGPSSETYGILGRINKDRWEAARDRGDAARARGLLDLAIETYLKGFQTDWRDAYPGINALTLMEVREPPDPRRSEILPVVRYAAARRVASGKPDYWDHATLLELAVLGADEASATTALTAALAVVRARWEPETTARNLGIIRKARTPRGQTVDWADRIEKELLDHAKL